MRNAANDGSESRSILVSPDADAERLDLFLARALTGCSRRQIQNAIGCGDVRVNGRRARKGQSVAAHDIVQFPEALQHPVRLEPNPLLTFSILYEDAAVIAVDKPAGVPSHALRRSETDTVANFLLSRDPALTHVGNRPLEAGLVHRLDTDTSGVLLAARTSGAYIDLRQQFAVHAISKEYLAIVNGDVVEAGEVHCRLAHDPRDRRRMCIVDGHEAQRRSWAAVTRYRPLEHFGAQTLLVVKIQTGVTHQIRVQLAAMGHAVVGDTLYGEPRTPVPRQFLHAIRVGFRHPDTGRVVEIASPRPTDFEAYVKQLRATTPAT